MAVIIYPSVYWLTVIIVLRFTDNKWRRQLQCRSTLRMSHRDILCPAYNPMHVTMVEVTCIRLELNSDFLFIGSIAAIFTFIIMVKRYNRGIFTFTIKLFQLIFLFIHNFNTNITDVNRLDAQLTNVNNIL